MKFIKADLNSLATYVSSGKLVSKEEFQHPDRIIDSYLILLGIKNTLYIQEDNDQYNLDKNTALMLTPHKRQASFKPSYNLSYYWCHFYFKNNNVTQIEYDEAIELYHMMNNCVFGEKDNTVLIPKILKLPYPDKLNILFRQLLDYSYGDYYTKNISDYCLAAMLTELTQQSIQYFTSDLSSTTYQFSEMVEWIKANVHKPLRVSHVANRFNYNPNYLSNLFKSKTGYSLIKFINHAKVCKAQELLLKTDNTIKEIAYDLGFSDDKYFLKVFKTYTDITPTQYRNAYYNTHINIK